MKSERLPLFVYFFIAIASVLSAMQTGSNAMLRRQLRHPTLSALVVEVVGFSTMLLVFVVYTCYTRQSLPTAEQWRSVPWWAWVGGCMGSVYAIAIVTVAEKVGAGRFLGLTVTMVVVTSLIMDHFALLGFQQHSAGLGRVIGAGLMIGGLVCIAKF